MTSSKKFNRLMSVLLLVCMLVSFAPTAYAEEATAENCLSAETTASADAVDTALTVEEEPVETEAPVIPEPPVAPGASSLNVTKYLFNIQCDTVHEHNYLCNWFGSNVVYNKDMQYDAERGVYTCSAYAKLATIVFSNIQRNYFGGMKHYWDNANPVIHLYYDPNATGLNSQGQEVTGLWLPDGEQVVHVYCYDKPAAPTNAAIEKLSSLKLLWLRDSDNTKNFLKPAKIIPGTYELGEMTGNSTDGFFCPLTITDIAPYIEAFNTKFPGEFPYMVDNDPEMPFPSLDFVLKYTGTTTDYKQDGTGWTLDASSYANNTEKLNGKTIWLARQDTLDYTVTYVDGVEEEELFADQSYTVKYGAETPAFVGTPEREGYTFEGWEPEVAETVTEDVTYTAVWAAKEYTVPVDYNFDDGDEPEDRVFTYEDVIKDVTGTPERAGYTFTGWVDQNGEPVDAEATYTENIESLNATWAITEYVITVDPANGEEPYEMTITYEDVIGEAVKTPVYEGYTFTGWVDKYGEPVDSESNYYEPLDSLTATWKLTEYAVVIDPANGEEASVVTYTYKDVIGDKYDFSKEPERTGYTFEGWVDQDGNPVDLTATYTEDVQSITASWKGKTYTVTFKLKEDEGTLSFTSKKVVFGDPLGYTPKVEREGYTFIGWYDSTGKYYDSTSIYEVDGNLTLTGLWTVTIVPTGDSNNAALFALLMLASLACGGVTVLRLRKGKEEA